MRVRPPFLLSRMKKWTHQGPGFQLLVAVATGYLVAEYLWLDWEFRELNQAEIREQEKRAARRKSWFVA